MAMASSTALRSGLPKMSQPPYDPPTGPLPPIPRPVKRPRKRPVVSSPVSATSPPVSPPKDIKLGKLRKPAKQTLLSSAYSNNPSLLSNGGRGYAVPVEPSKAGLSQESSPSPPRSSSAGGLYSIQATTFEKDGATAVPSLRNGSSVRVKGQDGLEKETKRNVLVSVRVRPDTAQDLKSHGRWMIDGRRCFVAFNGKESGKYFYAHDDNARVYEASAKGLVRHVMEGYHGTVFAYGMTGTGKTFSMQGTTEFPGVIPSAAADIFAFIRETPHREFLLRASYLEIYNEDIRDLLVQTTNGQPPDKIKLREDSERGVYATPLHKEIVQSLVQLLRVISLGDKARQTGHTQYNAHSSRSHAVVQIVVESRERATIMGEKGTANGPRSVRLSTLTLVDLAGSERAADTKERRIEGAHINRSLLTLGTIIAKLSASKNETGNLLDADSHHLPYRDSKLTRLLQPALSGKSLISILCTIQIGCTGSSASPNQHTGETLNTLKFAARAKNNIVSHAKKAKETVSVGAEAKGLLDQHRLKIAAIRRQLTFQTRAQLEKEEDQMGKQAHNRYQDQLSELQLARTALRERIGHLNRLILASQLTSLGYSGSFSALGLHRRLASSYGDAVGTALIRSSTSMSTLLRRRALFAPSVSSTAPNHQELQEDKEVILTDQISLEAQNKVLRSELADKNRYIFDLEQQLTQSRYVSSSRSSPALHLAMLKGEGLRNRQISAGLADLNCTVAQLRAQTKPSREPLLKIDTSSSGIASPKKYQ